MIARWFAMFRSHIAICRSASVRSSCLLSVMTGRLRLQVRQNDGIRHRSSEPRLRLKPKPLFDPVHHQIPVEEFEYGLFLDGGVTVGDYRGDGHVATAIEGYRQHGFRRWAAHCVGAAAAFHVTHGNLSAVAECRSSAADEFDISDTIKLLVIGYSGLAIAEADLRPQIEIDVGSAIDRFAMKGPSAPKLVDGERPRAFGPDRPMRTVRRFCRGEDRVAANPGKHGGD